MHKAIGQLGWLLSPSRKIIDHLKHGDREHRGRVLRHWSACLFWLEAFSCVVLSTYFSGHPQQIYHALAWLPVLYAYSRCNEIAYAFYHDALSRISLEAQQSDLSSGDRIRMAMRSYFGLAFNFALLYYFFPASLIADGALFKEPLASFFAAFYFSGVTLATLGYGDITPTHELSRLLSLYEVSAGILIVAVAIATYLGGVKEKESNKMIIVLIRRCVRPDKEAEFLASYNREKPKHTDFVAEHLTKVDDSADLPEPMRSFPICQKDCITYVNVAFWKSASSFVQNFKPETKHDPALETADRVRVVLNVVDL